MPLNRSFLFVLPVLCSTFATAATIPYPNAGTIPPVVALTASSTEQVTGYLYGSDAGGTDYVRMVDTTTGSVSPFLLSNHGSTVGAPVDFGSVNAGDNLVFQIVNSEVENNKDGTDFTHQGDSFDPNAQENSYLMASDPAFSVDNYNHAYVTAFDGSSPFGIPAGVFLGMEDLPFSAADLDYNDVEFVFTGVSAATATTPEPGSLALCGTGLLLAVFASRRMRAIA